ncbi:hypothetical protein NKJ88_31390 [Mesorhizobium sp. M0016]|uniref:hypothetical protein n=1 Tax=Mesorhizobium sp. M0016 TaxID=2956843 RepID=UPI00333D8EB7
MSALSVGFPGLLKPSVTPFAEAFEVAGAGVVSYPAAFAASIERCESACTSTSPAIAPDLAEAILRSMHTGATARCQNSMLACRVLRNELLESGEDVQLIF